MATTMTYGEWWQAVLGRDTAAGIVTAFDLTGPRASLDEWLGTAEEAAVSQGLAYDDETQARAYHARALADLCEAAGV